MTTYTYDVFLSHNSQDKPAVQWLAAKLEDQAGINVFLDVWDLIPGEAWQEDLENALAASRTVAVFLGPAGIRGWHNEELREALNRRVRHPERRVIPVLLPGATRPKEGDIPNFLQRLTWVVFENLENEESFHRLVAGIKGHAPGRAGAPGEPPPAPKPPKKEQPMSEKKIDTGGGAYIGGSVNTGGGDFVGRDKNVTASQGGVAIGGNVTGSTIVTGNNNVVGSTVNLQQQYIQQIYEAIDARPDMPSGDKADLKGEIREIQEEDAKGEAADETFIAHRLRNIQRIAPDILEVVLETIKNPVAGFSLVAKKVAGKMKLDAESQADR